jgi:hypothetical protein
MQHGVQQIHMQSLNVMGSSYLDSTEAEHNGTADFSNTRGCGGTSNNLVLHAGRNTTADNRARSGD